MAVFTEAELQSTANTLSMLENAVYLTEEESKVQPKLIPVKENSRLKGFVVRFEDVENLAESANCDYIAAMQSISEANNLDKPLIVAVDECDLIEDPSLLQELNNVVINPINENDIVYQYCENILNKYMETEDESLLEAFTKDQLENIDGNIDEKQYKHFAKNELTGDKHLKKDAKFNQLFNIFKNAKSGEEKEKAEQKLKDYTKNYRAKRNNRTMDAALRLKQYALNAKETSPNFKKIEKSANNPSDYTKYMKKIGYLSTDYDKLPENEQDKIFNMKHQAGLKITNDEFEKLKNARENEKAKNNKQYMKQQQNFYQKPNELQNMMHKDSEKINKVYNNPESSDKKQEFNAPAVVNQFTNDQQSNNIVSKYATRPKSVIVRKIAALRNLYHKWMIKAKTSKDTGFVAKIKRVCAKILGVIDKLLKIVNNKLKGKAQKIN